MGETGVFGRRAFVGACGMGLAAALAGVAVPSLAGCSGVPANKLRRVEDMIGRSVVVPETLQKVFCSNPIGTVDLYALAPEMLAGWNFVPSGINKRFISDEAMRLPSLGVWMGAGSTPNAEEIVRQNPDAILCYWTADDVGREMADGVQGETGIATLGIDYDIRSTPEMFRYVGALIGVEERAEELAKWCETQISRIEKLRDSVPAGKGKSIYLAQGEGGLSTDPVGSMHVTDALELCGVSNVADLPGTVGKGMGMPTVNLEQIISWDPDAVFVSEYSMSDTASSDIYGEIVADANWNNVPCVRDGMVFRIPQSPFSWFGRPPSVVRLLGCVWLMTCLYPELCADIDMREETREAYRMLYRYELSDNDLDELL